MTSLSNLTITRSARPPPWGPCRSTPEKGAALSIEAITWALNLAPVPTDRGSKPNSACASVLVGLANHAAPDGTGAFPAVRTLMRYTRLSERAVRKAINRLHAFGVIKPCDPALISARIKRADRRPQGWDLALDQIRDDLTEDDLAALEPQNPGLRARIAALSIQIHPVDNSREPGATPVENPPYGVHPVHPAHPTGCTQCRNGVHSVPERGAPSAPEPSLNRPKNHRLARATSQKSTSVDNDRPGGGGADGAESDSDAAGSVSGGEAEAFLTALGERWPLSRAQRRRIAPLIRTSLAAGWPPQLLAERVGANTHGVRSPYAALRARLSDFQDPPPPQPQQEPHKAPWCGLCDEQTRQVERPDGRITRCPRCHPLVDAARLGPTPTHV